MKVGLNKVGNRFPYILMYIIPRPLLIESSVKRTGYQLYKWLWFYIQIDKTIVQQRLCEIKKQQEHIHKWFECPNCKKVYELDD